MRVCACIVGGGILGLFIAAVAFLGIIEIADGRLADF